jgi:hypothetical protein
MMATFIASRIEEQAKISIELGQAKYQAYFVNTTRYLSWKADVDTILETDGFGACIVTA